MELTSQHISQVDTDDLIAEYLVTRGSIILDELIKRYLSIARNNARNMGMAFGKMDLIDDFLTWGEEGVWQAIITFDPTKNKQKRSLAKQLGARIITIVYKRVIDSYRTQIGNRYAHSLSKQYFDLLDEFYKENGFYPSFEEIQTELNKNYKSRNGSLRPTTENIYRAMGVATRGVQLRTLGIPSDQERADDSIDGSFIAQNFIIDNRLNLGEVDLNIMKMYFLDEIDENQISKQLELEKHEVLERKRRILTDIRQTIEGRRILNAYAQV